MSTNVADPVQLQRLLDHAGLGRPSDGVGFVILARVTSRGEDRTHNPDQPGATPGPATSLFTQTEPRDACQLRAVVSSHAAPEGPGSAGDKPLMRNRTADFVPLAPTGILPSTFSRESGNPQVRNCYGKPLPGAETLLLGVLLNKAPKARLALVFFWLGRVGLYPICGRENTRRHELARWLSVSPQLRRMG